MYGDDDLATVLRIRILLAAGLNTAQILEVLPCLVDDDGVLTPECPGLVDGLVQQRDRIDAAIGELAAKRANLDEIIVRKQPTG